MKEQFKGYYNLEEKEFEELWNNGIFIFDTNVLLNLYRYQHDTRDALLKVMEKLNNRVWIPYHVGLEFQRNRPIVIAEQYKKFSEVKNIIDKSILTMKKEFDNLQLKTRHSYINPDKLIENFESIKNSFFNDLKKLEETSINTSSRDEIRERIDILFKNNIGLPPKNQEEIDKVMTEGELRYKKNIPPGFKDLSKDEKNPDEFTYSNITYKSKYGDLIIWKQIIEHVKTNSYKNIVFVTDDSKADWLWKIESNGSKILGVRPELKDEFYRETNVKNFHIYNTKSFLSYANDNLNAKVTKEAIQEVGDISNILKNTYKLHYRSKISEEISERAVYRWLSSRLPNIEYNNQSYPDFITFVDDKKYGFEIKSLDNINSFRVLNIVKSHINKAYEALSEKQFHEISIIFYMFGLDKDIVNKIIYNIKEAFSDPEGNINIIIGTIEISDEDRQIYNFNSLVSFKLSEFI
ncbi:PIN-like domain-containing protein [Acinetobacter calcoaceticus]|uniref:PIN-like domain-containing protein n=1 Tax=Acinetobacter calcoaceticus TaxID=471 RepID=UPI0002E4BA05|nr:PIN-like domain-containing protein [Acinetobacter calcoaceticus]